MTIGQKIKMVRTLRGLTQKELGNMVGLTDVRIRQYEIDARNPKENLIGQLATALNVSSRLFTDHSIDTYEDIMHVLLELEQTSGAQVIQISDTPPKYAITFENYTLNGYLGAWYDRKNLDNPSNGTAYDLWKARFPFSFDEDCKNNLRKIRENPEK